MRERAPLQLSFVGIEVRVLRPVRVCLDAVALLRVERQAGKSVAKKRESVSTQTASPKRTPKPPPEKTVRVL